MADGITVGCPDTLTPTAVVGEVVRLVHETEGTQSTLATDIRLADSPLARMRGLMLRPPLAAGEALVFRFDGVGTRRIHGLFVAAAFDVVWVADGTVEAVATLSPWVGYGRGRADLVAELPAGAAEDVAVGDELRLVATPGG